MKIKLLLFFELVVWSTSLPTVVKEKNDTDELNARLFREAQTKNSPAKRQYSVPYPNYFDNGNNFGFSQQFQSQQLTPQYRQLDSPIQHHATYNADSRLVGQQLPQPQQLPIPQLQQGYNGNERFFVQQYQLSPHFQQGDTEDRRFFNNQFHAQQHQQPTAPLQPESNGNRRFFSVSRFEVTPTQQIFAAGRSIPSINILEIPQPRLIQTDPQQQIGNSANLNIQQIRFPYAADVNHQASNAPERDDGPIPRYDEIGPIRAPQQVFTENVTPGPRRLIWRTPPAVAIFRSTSDRDELNQISGRQLFSNPQIPVFDRPIEPTPALNANVQPSYFARSYPERELRPPVENVEQLSPRSGNPFFGTSQQETPQTANIYYSSKSDLHRQVNRNNTRQIIPTPQEVFNSALNVGNNIFGRIPGYNLTANVVGLLGNITRLGTTFINTQLENRPPPLITLLPPLNQNTNPQPLPTIFPHPLPTIFPHPITTTTISIRRPSPAPESTTALTPIQVNGPPFVNVNDPKGSLSNQPPPFIEVTDEYAEALERPISNANKVGFATSEEIQSSTIEQHTSQEEDQPSEQHQSQEHQHTSQEHQQTSQENQDNSQEVQHTSQENHVNSQQVSQEEQSNSPQNEVRASQEQSEQPATTDEPHNSQEIVVDSAEESQHGSKEDPNNLGDYNTPAVPTDDIPPEEDYGTPDEDDRISPKALQTIVG